MLRNRLDIQLRNVFLIFRVYSWLQSLWTPWTPFAPSLEPLQYTAESRDRTGSQHDIQCSEPAAVAEDRSAALGSRRCELPGMHSVPTSAVLPYASGVGGLSRRLLNNIGDVIFSTPNVVFSTPSNFFDLQGYFSTPEVTFPPLRFFSKPRGYFFDPRGSFSDP